MKKILVGLFILMAFISNAKTYNLVTLQYPPYEYEEEGIKKGFIIEIMQEIFNNLNLDYNIEVLPWKRAMSMVKNGDSDLIFTIYKNDEREEYIDFSDEILVMQKASFFTLKENNEIRYFGDFDNLINYKIGTEFDVSYGKKFDKAVAKGLLCRHDVINSEINVKKLINKRVELIVSNEYGALYFLKKHKALDRIKKLEPAIEEIPSYIGFSKKNNLEGVKKMVEDELRRLKANGRYQEIIEGYFLED